MCVWIRRNVVVVNWPIFLLGDGAAIIMLIRWVGQVAERITIGELRENAWEGLPKEKKYIMLS
jgi:hypothetical protein